MVIDWSINWSIVFTIMGIIGALGGILELGRHFPVHLTTLRDLPPIPPSFIKFPDPKKAYFYENYPKKPDDREIINEQVTEPDGTNPQDFFDDEQQLPF